MRLGSLFVLAILLSAAACDDKSSGSSQPNLSDMEKQANDKEAKKKADDAAAAAKEKSAFDALMPKVADQRKQMEQKLAAVYDALPKTDLDKRKRETCPDAKFASDSPDRRKVLLVNQEVLYRLAGKPEGGSPAFHTLAGDDASSMVRPDGKETPLVTRAAPTTSNEAQAILDGIAFVNAHPYLGVAQITRYKPSHSEGTGATPAHVEGMNEIYDLASGKYLCQVEASADNLAGKTEALQVGKALLEDLWSMYVLASSKNLAAVSQVLTVEGAPAPKR